MIGIVVVSHSLALAEAAVDLASQMAPPERRPVIRVAAGLDGGGFGTDATAVAAAIRGADSPDGILILADLGSAVLSSELALELVEPDIAQRAQVCPAPLVEGLVAAVATASAGGDRAAAAAEANAGLAAKVEHLGPGDLPAGVLIPGAAVAGPAPDAAALVWQGAIENEHGLHVRPAAALVANLGPFDAQIQLSNQTLGKGPVLASSLAGMTTLGLRRGDVLAARITGPEAAAALAALRELAANRFGEGKKGAAASKTADADDAAAPEAADSAQTGRQIVVGPAQHLAAVIDVSGYLPGDAAAERTRLDEAVAAVLARLQAKAREQTRHFGIFAAQGALLEDPELAQTLHAGIAEGRTAVAIVEHDFAALAHELDALDDPYLRERAQDIRSLARQLTAELTGAEIDVSEAEGILIVSELDPFVASSLNPSRCLGVVTCSGGATGHGVIVAAARGIPVVTGQKEAADIPNRTIVGLDPVHQRLWVNPTMAELAEIDRLAVERRNEATLAAELCQEPAVTQAGRRILVEANIGCLDDALTALGNGADGAGLVRTEVLFADWDHAPTAAEQADSFQRLGQALGGRMLTIRTWDPGGDKPLAFLPQAPEANPMLGERGLRAMRRAPELFHTQLEAVALASRRTPVRVLFPMVCEPAELRWAADKLTQVLGRTGGHVAVGMMVETPAAALRAADFGPLVDFISIGTNDLTQYAMAADRGNSAVAHLAQGEHPAVWDLIRLAAKAFAGRPIAVCGDYASQPELVPRLVAAGATELSVRPPLVGLVKLAVRTRA
ncbi:MAG: HPr family phosphocarrier protein [Propionibacteriaceae bacterium]|jgi:phosphocarrier protein FPr|nr:HPr family phosphocarrier protein [Propionibacteriaceae bacterium]